MATTERAVLAGGCFWGMQDLIRKMPGVISSRVGYTGGTVEHATYRRHDGHAEAIEIVFDPAQLSFRKLLEFFFQIHDPSTKNRQGNDMGSSYRSAIFYTSDEQKRVSEDTIADVDASGLWPNKVSLKLFRSGLSGKLRRSTRIIWSGFRMAIHATMCGRTGCCRSVRLRRRGNADGFCFEGRDFVLALCYSALRTVSKSRRQMMVKMMS